MASSGKRHTVTVEKRLEILRKLEEGFSVDDVAVEYGVSKRTIRRYKHKSAPIRQLCENPARAQTKRQRASVYETMETRLYEWVLQRQALGDVLTNGLLQDKAKELQQEFGSSSSFTASQGWLSRFKARYDIRLGNVNEERADANELAAEKFIDELAEMLRDEGFEDDCIYNMGVSSLMWKALPSKALVHRGVLRANSGKVKKDHVTVAFCANSTGTHNLPLLFVYKYANPRALKHCKENLPVVYTHQYNSWINEQIFTDWYINHFKESVREYQLRDHRAKKVLLLVDNFKWHIIPEELREDDHFKLIFLPPNTASIIQPMDQGVIVKCKQLFRHQLLRQVLQYPGGINEFYLDYDIKDSIDIIANSWSNVTPEDIRNSWRRLLRHQYSSEHPEANPESFRGTREQTWKTEENLNQEKVTEWFMECESEESTVYDTIGPAEETMVIEPECIIEEEEIDDMFRNLEKPGCPPHYAHVSRQVLDRQFPNRCIGRGGEFLWPQRSTDLTPLNYFLWGTLKDIVYREPTTTPENMKERIREACSILAAETIQSAVSSLIDRLHQCINVNGHHFEHLR
ncbi:PREDICTED: jerky protein homolog-like [Dufourea novaeangliae]|nr:PREDICTED: jerky protein homolog-like [Dufourea novaeangliae]